MKCKVKTYTAVALTLSCMLLMTACNYTVGSYSSGTKDSYTFQYAFFNGTKTHTLQLEEGDVLNVELVCEKGTLGVILQQKDGEPLYETDNASTDTFSLEVEESGKYELTLTANEAKGSVDFYMADETSTEETP